MLQADLVVREKAVGSVFCYSEDCRHFATLCNKLARTHVSVAALADLVALRC